jgi:hypothetical protein
LDGDDGLSLIKANAATEPLVAAFFEVEAIGGEGIAEGTDRATLVVITPERPKRLVVVGLMGTQTDRAAGFEKIVNDAQDRGIAEGGVTGDVFDVQSGMEGGKLEELGGERNLLTSVGGGEVVEQDDVETAGGIGEEKWEAGVSIARVPLFGII